MKSYTSWHTWRDAEPGLRALLPAGTVLEIGRAVEFAVAHHGDQRRKTGAPYLEHLLEAVQILAEGAGIAEPDVLVATVLHDVVEDTTCTLADLAAAFGQRVAELVGWVTIPEPGPGETASAVKSASLRRLRNAPRDAILVKLADRASNVQTLRNLSPRMQHTYYAQTVEYIVPLAAADQWLAGWYADWKEDFADLGDRRPANPDGSAARRE